VNDPRRLRPIEVCRLLNSTPLGEVITEQDLRNHRVRAAQRLGAGRSVDMLRYTAWLVHVRHMPKADPKKELVPPAHLAEAAKGAAAVVSRRSKKRKGHGQKMSRKQETVIAALLTEPSYAQAAAKAGISESTIYNWLRQRTFRAAFRQARRELLDSTVGRLQAATGLAVDTLVAVATHGRRDSDRVRASVALLSHAFRGLEDADLLQGPKRVSDDSPMGTSEVVGVLSKRLRQIDKAELAAAEKSRLTAALADALLRAINVDVLDQRLESLQAVLSDRKNSFNEDKKSKAKKRT
jgi:hypothetical protein